MAWNEPGGNNQDPWGGRGGDQGPPDLDEVVRKMQDKFSGLFGGRKGGRSSGGGNAGTFGISLIVAIALLVWLASGVYIIDPAERGVVLRFGKNYTTVGEGPHWHIPYPVEQVLTVNVDQLRPAQHRAQMLTADENLIQIALSVQYQVKNAEDYLFNVKEPDVTLKEATESALREVVGSKKLDDILSETGGREVLVNETAANIQDLLDRYKTGLRVSKVNLESAQPPQEVQAAFDDAIKAREDEDRFKKQAEAYERDIIPKAEGDAERLIQESEAYKQQVTEKALGETSRFLQTLAEYKKAPAVTRKRIYLDTMEDVLSSTSKVMIKMDQGNSIMYLPLDQFLGNKNRSVTGSSTSSRPEDFNVGGGATTSRQQADALRLREGR